MKKTTTDRSRTSRRTYLKSLAGTTAALSTGIAGCLGQSGDAPAEGDATPADDSAEPTTDDSTRESESPSSPGQNGIHAQYGFIGESMESPAPVEADHEVQLLIGERENAPVPTFYFEPTGLFVEPGDIVKFVFSTPDHAVTAYHPGLGRTARVPGGVPALSSPMMTAGTYWLFRFDTPGVHDLYCPPHEAFGMAMRVVAGEATGPGAKDISMGPPKHGEPRPPMQTSATVLSDDALAPESIVENEMVQWGDLAPESKQLQSGP